MFVVCWCGYVSLLHSVCFFYSGVCGYLHPCHLVYKNKTMARPLLSPSYDKDNIGNFLVVECGSLKGQFYVDKMDSTKCGA